MKIKEVVRALERFAPLPLQESYDNAGLQTGLTEAEVSGALLCLDVTEAVVEEAVLRGCNVVVSHHPLLFHPLKCISEESHIGRTVLKAIRNDVAIISMHTNIDAAEGGVNFKIAEKIGLQNPRFFGGEKEANGVKGGEGVVGEFAVPVAPADFIALVKERFNAACVRANSLLQRPIATVAICGGAGAFLLKEAIRIGADAFLTGEMKYNEWFGCEGQIQIAAVGHYESEQFTPEIFRDILSEAGVPCFITTVDTNPVHCF